MTGLITTLKDSYIISGMSKTIAVIFGGRSAEHDVSIVTAISSIIKPLETTKKYKIEPVYISKEGTWYWDSKLKDIDLFTSGKIDDYLHKARSASVQFDDGMTLTKPKGVTGGRKTAKIDIVFPSMHGTYGEDGALMGLLDIANVPYIGCGTSASAVAMDKVLSKQVAAANNIPVANYQYFFGEIIWENTKEVLTQIEGRLSYPLFIKPAHLGSSIGISRAENDKELANGLEVAAHYDDKVLIEEEIKNLTEVTLPIMGNNKLHPALLEKPLTRPKDFFDFDTKYLQGGKKNGKKDASQGIHSYSELPAKMDKSLYDKAVKTGKAVYRALGCSGIARVDMLIDKKSKTVYFNELNPLPGGLYSHNWRAAGVSSVDLVECLIRLALDRHEQRQKVTTTFGTDYLKQF